MVYVPSAGAPCPRPIRIITAQSCRQAGWSSLSQCCPGITAVGLHALSVLRSSLSEPDEHSPLLSGLGSFCDCRQCRAPRPRRCLRVTYVRWWTSSAMLISLWSPECVPFASSSRDHSRHFGQCSGSLSQSVGVVLPVAACLCLTHCIQFVPVYNWCRPMHASLRTASLSLAAHCYASQAFLPTSSL